MMTMTMSALTRAAIPNLFVAFIKKKSSSYLI